MMMSDEEQSRWISSSKRKDAGAIRESSQWREFVDDAAEDGQWRFRRLAMQKCVVGEQLLERVVEMRVDNDADQGRLSAFEENDNK